jgi:UPF0755 protein
MTLVKRLGIFIFFFVNLSLIGGCFFYHFFLNTPLGFSKIISIKKKSTIRKIAIKLDQLEIFRFPLLIRFYCSFYDLPLKPGEYFFPQGTQPWHAFLDIKEGRNIKYYFKIPEGLRVEEIVKKLESEPLLSGSVVRYPKEGALLPQTYQFLKGDDRQALLDRMTMAMDQVLEIYWQIFPHKDIIRTKEEFLILASIVEKETAIAEEKPKIACVFLNRLKKRMRLQADPTVVYGLKQTQVGSEEGSRFPLILYKKHLEIKHPYNTYKISGLPPGPICCPGELSLEATAKPAEDNFIFFVANGSGGHNFTGVFHEHQKNHASWRRFKKKN